MREKSKTAKTVSMARIDGYHAGGNWQNAEAYAFAGFKSNKYFTSDRHIALNERFERVDGKPLKGFGLEIETECRGISNAQVLAEVYGKIIFPQFPADLFKMQRDSSLGGETSAECITQIMTKEFVRNSYPAFKAMYDTYFPAFGISAASANCGMHVNISVGLFGRSEAAQALAIKKLYYIVNKHFNLCAALFHRDRSRTGYCSRMNSDKDYVKNMDLTRQNCSHGVSFNLGHYNAGRIEIRLVGGQKNFPCFRNTMESVFFLCDAVKALSWDDCDDIVKIFSGCNQYVYDRLKSYCYERGTISADQLAAIRATIKREDLF